MFSLMVNLLPRYIPTEMLSTGNDLSLYFAFETVHRCKVEILLNSFSLLVRESPDEDGLSTRGTQVEGFFVDENPIRNLLPHQEETALRIDSKEIRLDLNPNSFKD